MNSEVAELRRLNKSLMATRDRLIEDMSELIRINTKLTNRVDRLEKCILLWMNLRPDDSDFRVIAEEALR